MVAHNSNKSSRPSPHGAMANAAARGDKRLGLEEFLGVFRYSSRAVELVWTTSKLLTVLLALLTLVAGLLPAGGLEWWVRSASTATSDVDMCLLFEGVKGTGRLTRKKAAWISPQV